MRKIFFAFLEFFKSNWQKNKELCNVIVVCENTIIIISVKDITISEHKEELIKSEKWIKKVIHDSVDQIYGVERFLETVDEIFLKDKKTKIKLPPKESRIIHRVSIAFRSADNFPFPNGNFGKGNVSVFDEKSTFTILNELDL